MKRETLRYYDRNALSLSNKYNSIEFSDIQNEICNYFSNCKKVLEIGSGSGRDANYFLSKGFDLTCIDGSQEMIDLSVKTYPKLKDRIIKSVLPNEFPQFECKFDVAFSVATLIHFSYADIKTILSNFKSVLKEDAKVVISVSGKRDNERTDRYFNDFDLQDWRNIFVESHFVINNIKETRDSLNREIDWYTFFMKTN